MVFRQVPAVVVGRAVEYAQDLAKLWRGIQKPGTRLALILSTHDVQWMGTKKRLVLMVACALACSRHHYGHQ